MGVLKTIGGVLILAWLVLWLTVKTIGFAVHILVALGIAMLVIGFLKSDSKG